MKRHMNSSMDFDQQDLRAAKRSNCNTMTNISAEYSRLERQTYVDNPDLTLREIRDLWQGIQKLRTLVIFGDSFSSPVARGEEVDGEEDNSQDESSIGDKNEIKWIDHFMDFLNKPERNKCVHNYAISGDTTEDDFPDQLRRFFRDWPPKSKPSDTPLLNQSETLYVLVLGINDCGRTDTDELEPIIEYLFDSLHELYVKAGARNFILFDVPPVHRSPSGLASSIDIQRRIEAWNNLLQSQSTTFASEASQASVFIFSANRVLQDILDNPEKYGFNDDDVEQEGSAIWTDELHLRTAVHEVIATRLEKALSPL